MLMTRPKNTSLGTGETRALVLMKDPEHPEEHSGMLVQVRRIATPSTAARMARVCCTRRRLLTFYEVEGKLKSSLVKAIFVTVERRGKTIPKAKV